MPSNPSHLTVKLAAAACLCLLAFNASALDLRGFRGLSWGDSAERLGPAEVARRDGDIACYYRERENLLFGDNPVTGVRYCFHQDHLYMVSIESDGNRQLLLNEFQRTYGKPVSPKAKTSRWGTTKTASRAELTPVSTGTVTSRLTIYSNHFDPALNSKPTAKAVNGEVVHTAAEAF